MREVYVPKLLEAWLRSDSATLKELCKEDVLTKLMHDIAARKKEKVSPDPNVLSVDHAEVGVDYKRTPSFDIQPAFLVLLKVTLCSLPSHALLLANMHPACFPDYIF